MHGTESDQNLMWCFGIQCDKGIFLQNLETAHVEAK